MFRPAGASPSAESWHRDESKYAEDADTVFGGWLNLDDQDQFFSCVPGTHTQTSKNKGFAKISDKSQIESFNQTKTSVRIPPGHILIFYERMVHEVVSGKKKYNMYRLFLGWRLTYSNKSLIDLHLEQIRSLPDGDVQKILHKDIDMLNDLEYLLQNQAIIPIKSGQMPPMYSKMHWNFPKQRDALENFSKAFKNDVLTQRTVRQGKDEGRIYQVVPNVMPSLKKMELDLYPNYTKLEMDLHYPATLEKSLRIVSSLNNTRRRASPGASAERGERAVRPRIGALGSSTIPGRRAPPAASAERAERAVRPRIGALGSSTNPLVLDSDDEDSDDEGTRQNPILL